MHPLLRFAIRRSRKCGGHDQASGDGRVGLDVPERSTGRGSGVLRAGARRHGALTHSARDETGSDRCSRVVQVLSSHGLDIEMEAVAELILLSISAGLHATYS
jgi:hypothetical protein